MEIGYLRNMYSILGVKLSFLLVITHALFIRTQITQKMFFSTIEMLESLKNPQKQYGIMKLYRPASNEGFSSSSPENSGKRSVSYGHH